MDATSPTDAPLSVGGRRPGVEYHAEHAVATPTAPTSCCWSPTTGPPSSGSPAARCRAELDQDASAWSPLRPEDPAERLERVDAFAGHVVLDLARGRAQPAAHPGRADRPDRRGHGRGRRPGMHSPSLGDASTWNVEHDVDRSSSSTSPTSTRRSGPTSTRPPASAPSGSARRRPVRPRGVRRRAAHVPVAPTAPPFPRRSCGTADTPLDGSAPCLMYAYGAYEAVYPDQEWDPAIPSLLDRGVVYVHAHVRGGGEGGRRWWLDGRMEHKQHTFDDHIAVADGLAASGLVDGSRIATRGLSAGGLLQGAVFSQRPDRWRAVVAEVPVRRRADHDARRDDPAHRQRVGRVGRPVAARADYALDGRPTRRTTTRRRRAPAPTCWPPARSTTPA